MRDKIKERKKAKEEIPKENEEEKRIRKSIKNVELTKEAMQFFSRNSAHIEVQRNGEVERVRFMLLPYCHELPKVGYFALERLTL